MRPLTLRKKHSARTSASADSSDRVLEQILTGPDTAHRRELEILLEERTRSVLVVGDDRARTRGRHHEAM